MVDVLPVVEEVPMLPVEGVVVYVEPEPLIDPDEGVVE